MDKLRTRITEEINDVSQVILKKVFRNMIVHAHTYINSNGGHFQDLLEFFLPFFCI